MGSNIIELAKLGHERAAELKASCGSVDVRSVAQLISDLATQLEVQYVCAEESQREFRSADITMQNLEAKLKQSKIDADCYKKGMEASNVRLVQLAAENAALKKAAEFSTAEDMWIEQADGMLDYRYVDWYVDVLKAAMETPATDAFLAEVRASAIPDEATERDLFEEWVMEKIFISKATLEGLRTDDGYRNSTLSGTDYNGMWSQWKAIRAAQLRQEAAQ